MGKTTAFDAADYLDNDEMLVEYLNQPLASGDTDLLFVANCCVANALDKAQVTRDWGIGGECLIKDLTDGAKPAFFGKVFNLPQAVGVQMYGHARVY